MNYFKSLNINDKSSVNDIKKAYYKLVLKHHPDKGGNQETFINIQNYYTYLLKSINTNNSYKSSTNNSDKSSNCRVHNNNYYRSNTKSPAKLFFSLVVGYITLRHLLPKKDIIHHKQNEHGKLVAQSNYNFLLFNRIQTWYDGKECQPINSYFWRRTNFIFCDNCERGFN